MVWPRHISWRSRQLNLYFSCSRTLTATGGPPSTGTTYQSTGAPPNSSTDFAVTSTCFESGDHTGQNAVSKSGSSCTGWPPSALTTNTLFDGEPGSPRAPVNPTQYAMYLPSGEKRGLCPSAAIGVG